MYGVVVGLLLQIAPCLGVRVSGTMEVARGWGDLFSRWVTVPSVSVRSSAVYAASDPDETLLSKQAIRDA